MFQMSCCQWCCFKRQWAEAARKERARGEVRFDVSVCWEMIHITWAPRGPWLNLSLAPLAALDLWSPAKACYWCCLGRQLVGQRQRTGEGWIFHWKNYLLGKKKSNDVCGREGSPASNDLTLTFQGRFLTPGDFFFFFFPPEKPANPSKSGSGIVLEGWSDCGAGCMLGLWTPTWKGDVRRMGCTDLRLSL